MKHVRALWLSMCAFLGAMMFSLPAHAAIDVTSVVQEIKDTITPISTIGAAVLLVVVAIAAYRWVRRGING